MQQVSATISPLIALGICFPDSLDPAGRHPLCVDQSHRADLSYPARFAMAGPRPLVLDSYVELSDERPGLRHRVAERAAVVVHEIRSGSVSAQFCSLSAVAWAGV